MRRQLQHMIERNLKVELQALHTLGMRFLDETFLLHKLAADAYI